MCEAPIWLLYAIHLFFGYDVKGTLHVQGDRYENIQAALNLLPQHGIEVRSQTSVQVGTFASDLERRLITKWLNAHAVCKPKDSGRG